MALAVITVALVVFLGGTAAGVLFVVSLASLREDRKASIDAPATNKLTQGARAVTGLYVYHIINAGPVSASKREKTVV
jgi:hypothetical protein